MNSRRRDDTLFSIHYPSVFSVSKNYFKYSQIIDCANSIKRAVQVHRKKIVSHASVTIILLKERFKTRIFNETRPSATKVKVIYANLSSNFMAPIIHVKLDPKQKMELTQMFMNHDTNYKNYQN